MAICVEIQIDDDGNVEIGMDPQAEANDGDHMQPVESIDVALSKAKAYLAGKMPSKPKTMQEAMFPEKSGEEPDAEAAKKA